MQDGWADLVHDLTIDTAGMVLGQFVIVEHCAQLDPNPYVQAAPDRGGGWYCEVVSAAYLPAGVWPIDEGYLRRRGWTPPADPRDNWSRTADSPGQVAELLADGLRYGRLCPDWQQVMWRIHRFPRPPDDDRDDPPAHPPPGQPGARRPGDRCHLRARPVEVPRRHPGTLIGSPRLRATMW